MLASVIFRASHTKAIYNSKNRYLFSVSRPLPDTSIFTPLVTDFNIIDTHKKKQNAMATAFEKQILHAKYVYDGYFIDRLHSISMCVCVLFAFFDMCVNEEENKHDMRIEIWITSNNNNKTS